MNATTEQELRKMALDGSDEEWAGLHDRCTDRAFAKSLAQALGHSPPDHRDRARQWLGVLQEIHPDLIINDAETAPVSQVITPAVAPEKLGAPSRGASIRCRSLRALVARFASRRLGL
jgi:hypothetical protein